MSAFQSPFEYLELCCGLSITFVPERWEKGEYTFQVGARTKIANGYRIWLSQNGGSQKYATGNTGDLRGQMIGSNYIDIGQSRLRLFLDGLLPGVIPHMTVITITAFGAKPKTQFQVSAKMV